MPVTATNAFIENTSTYGGITVSDIIFSGSNGWTYFPPENFNLDEFSVGTKAYTMAVLPQEEEGKKLEDLTLYPGDRVYLAYGVVVAPQKSQLTDEHIGGVTFVVRWKTVEVV